MNGSAMLPPVDTPAHGLAWLTFTTHTLKADTLTYGVYVYNLVRPTFSMQSCLRRGCAACSLHCASTSRMRMQLAGDAPYLALHAFTRLSAFKQDVIHSLMAFS